MSPSQQSTKQPDVPAKLHTVKKGRISIRCNDYQFHEGAQHFVLGGVWEGSLITSLDFALKNSLVVTFEMDFCSNCTATYHNKRSYCILSLAGF